MLLTDRVAVITGGGGGIGRAIALACASVGADVVIGDIIPERCEEVAARVREAGRRSLAVPTDVTDTGQVRALIDSAASSFRAHRHSREQRRRCEPAAVHRSVRTFVAAPYRSQPGQHARGNLCRCAAMIRGGRGGSIINVSSIEGSRAAPNFAVYGACKAAMLNFTRTMALELAEHGIRVNAIAPDYTVTPGLRGNHTGPVDPSTWIKPSARQEDATARRIPLGRPGMDTECGNAAVFLASAMGSYVTGAVIPVDGGTWASSGWIRDQAGNWTLTGDTAS